MRTRKKGQSTLEYLLVLAAVVGLIIFAAGQWVRPGIEASFGNTKDAIGLAADKL
jgi:uncharacterized protein (UPF0333 family)